ncbi:MAG: 1,2-phenylacetyl-CoA epoxidase subunit PaaC, partial [Anaerolineales bacterium]
TPATESSPADAVLALADDEMILAHRDSEWTGHAPILEEDIAFANLALDEMGHAQLWYRLVAELRGEDPETYPDRLIFTRPAAEYRNLRMVELPRGDWAFSMLRHYLFDALEHVRLRALRAGAEPRIRAVASKITPEETYHLRHTSAWVTRLGQGTPESHARMQAAVAGLWPFVSQMLAAEALDEVLDPGALRPSWESIVLPHLTAAGIEPAAVADRDPEGRTVHTPHLSDLVGEMQQVARAEPKATW